MRSEGRIVVGGQLRDCVGASHHGGAKTVEVAGARPAVRGQIAWRASRPDQAVRPAVRADRQVDGSRVSGEAALQEGARQSDRLDTVARAAREDSFWPLLCDRPPGTADDPNRQRETNGIENT